MSSLALEYQLESRLAQLSQAGPLSQLRFSELWMPTVAVDGAGRCGSTSQPSSSDSLGTDCMAVVRQKLGLLPQAQE